MDWVKEVKIIKLERIRILKSTMRDVKNDTYIRVK